MVRQGKILGHIVSKNDISTDFEKIKVIVELPRPRNAKQVQGFMGHCGYYRRFIYMYAIIARPLYALITVFIWIEECEEYFNKLEECLTSAPILKSPDWNVIFHVHIDASNFAIGAILAQPGEKNMDFPISYASRQLNSAEQNYTTIERERRVRDDICCEEIPSLSPSQQICLLHRSSSTIIYSEQTMQYGAHCMMVHHID